MRICRITPHTGNSESIYKPLIRGSVGGFGFNTIANLLFFIISILLARSLGASNYGIYIYAISWMAVLGVFSDFGLNRLLVRNIASYHANEKWAFLRGQLTWALMISLVASIATATIAIIVFYQFRNLLQNDMLIPLLIAMLALPLMSLLRNSQAALRGFHKILHGQVAEILVQPLTFFILICIFGLFLPDKLDSTTAIWLYIVSISIALILSIFLLARYLPGTAANTDSEWLHKEWLHSSLSMLLIGGLHIINSRTDIIMLGILSDTAETGIYGICVRGADLVMFLVIPVYTALMPMVAKLHTSEMLAELQDIVIRSARIVFVISLPIFIILTVFGNWFLLIYGTEFTSGHLALAILCFGKIIIIGIGPAALLLTMTGFEKSAALGVGLSAIINIVLNSLMIPIWGMEGAAVATSISTVLLAGLMSLWVVNKLSIRPDIFGKI